MLSVRSVSKTYGSVTALSDVTVEFSPGEVHAVIGENGAGKSTLMGILAGFVEPSRGSVLLDGSPLPVGRPFETRRLGVGMVHQHFTLVQEMTIAENLALAQVSSVYGRLSLPTSVDSGGFLSGGLDLGLKVRDVSVGVQQRVEILKSLSGDPSVVIFDEPTAVLSPNEALDLLEVLRELRSAGKTVILIAHKLKEVLAVADQITVLRKGRVVASVPRAEADERKLAEWMVGELPSELTKTSPESGSGLEITDLRARGDRGNLAVDGVSFSIGAGEVLGIGGVDGNGQVELAEALACVRKPLSGELRWKGEALAAEVSVGYVPQDRQLEGLALRMTVQDNLLIGGIGRDDLSVGPFLRPARIGDWARGVVEQFSITVGDVRDPVESLSGGNQQKVVVGRVLDSSPALLVVVNPTRGLDVQATDFVHRQILKARGDGAAVALFSTDLDELAALADRTLFMSGGKLVEAAGAVSVVGGSDGD